MPYQEANIDRAIVRTQFDLRGFYLMGFRHEGVSPRDLSYIPWNLESIASNGGGDGTFYKKENASYEDILAMCVRLASDCDESQKEAIQLIIQDLLKIHAKLTAEVAAGERERTPYLAPIDKNDPWGCLVLALMEAFQVHDANTCVPVLAPRGRQPV